MNEIIIAVDPGREKCGIAIVEQQTGVLTKKVINTTELAPIVQQLSTDYHTTTLVLGDGTSSREAKQTLEQIKITGLPLKIIFIDERHSTDEARCRYWRENPPQGFKRFIPVTMQVPPGPVDDYVAIILAERYFAKNEK